VENADPPIDKETIRRHALQVSTRLRSAGELSDEVTILDDEARAEQRLQIIKAVDVDASELSRLEKDLIREYIYHELQSAEVADRWLDKLPPLAIDKPPAPTAPPRNLLMFTIFGSTFVQRLIASLPDFSNASALVAKYRIELKQIWSSAAVAVVFTASGLDGLIYEIVVKRQAANWLPPCLFLLIALIFAYLAIALAKRTPNAARPELVRAVGLKLTIFTSLALGVSIALHMPTVVGVVVLLLAAILTVAIGLSGSFKAANVESLD
jgi:hypothetical protein